MAVDVANLKFYAAASPLGGDIDLSAEQTSAVIGNEIARITATERTQGTEKYVKQFLRNENAEDWEDVRVYLSSRTQLTPNTTISIAITGTKSMLQTASALSGSATVTATGWFATSSDLRQEIKPGERVYNSTNDTLAQAQRVYEVGQTYIKLESGYSGTAGAGKTLAVAPATMALFISPTSVEDITSPIIDIPSMGVCGVWKRYIVLGGCPQFSNDWFTTTFEEY